MSDSSVSKGGNAREIRNKVQEQFKQALQLAAEELANTEPPEGLPSPEEVSQLVEEAMFGFYGAFRSESS